MVKIKLKIKSDYYILIRSMVRTKEKYGILKHNETTTFCRCIIGVSF